MSEQTSPQVARAVGLSQKWDEGGGLISGSRSIRRFHIQSNFLGGAGKDRRTVVLSFTGEHTQKVDGKGRTSIPADFRRVLEAGDPDWAPGLSPRMYLLYGDHLKNELHGYTVAEFNTVVEQINALPRGSDRKKILARLIIGQSIKLDVDKDGRIVMPIKQRQKLDIAEGELTFSGLGDHFEIWKSETFGAEVADDRTNWLADKPDGYDPLILLDE